MKSCRWRWTKQSSCIWWIRKEILLTISVRIKRQLRWLPPWLPPWLYTWELMSALRKSRASLSKARISVMICLTAFTINYLLPKIKGDFKLISGLCIWGLFLLDWFSFLYRKFICLFETICKISWPIILWFVNGKFFKEHFLNNWFRF